MAKTREELFYEAEKKLSGLSKSDLIDMIMEKLDDLDDNALADWVDSL
jgi:hypothetical protein